MSKIKYHDYPFHECAAEANKLVMQGFDVYQKYTCANCGSRQTFEEANTFHTQGRCEECGHITDIAKQGCNYMLTAMISRKRNA